MESFFTSFTLEAPMIYATLGAFILLLWLIISILGLFKFSEISILNLMFFWALFPFVICVESLLFRPSLIYWTLLIILTTGPLLFIGRVFAKRYNIKLKLSQICSSFNQLSKLEKLVTLFIFAYLSSKFFKSLTPGAQNDVLTYALLAPKDWALFNESITFRKEFPNLFMSTYFEYFYYAYFVLFKNYFIYLTKLSSSSYEFYLAVIQIFAQMIIGTASYLFIPVLIYLNLRKNLYAVFLVIILIESLQLQTWTWYLAKNDSIPFFISLFATYLIFHKKAFSIAALLLGVALGVKFSNIYPLFLISLFLLIRFRKELDIKKMILVAPLFLIGFCPIFIRNYLFTVDPFYPVNILWFKNNYFSKNHMDYINTYSAPSTFLVAYNKLVYYFSSLKQVLVLMFISVLFNLYLFPIVILVLIFILSKISGPPVEWRLYSTLLLIYIFWVKALFDVPKVTKLKKEYLFLVILPFILMSKFNIETFWKTPTALMKSVGSILTIEQENFKLIVDNNLKNYNVKDYQFISSVHDIYYSRFKSISNEMGRDSGK